METEYKTFLIVGLGNPGLRYKGTRHNLGFMVLDEIAGIKKTRFIDEQDLSIAVAADNDNRIVLVKPLTYMNRSGSVMPNLLHRYSVPLSQLLVICDDVNLPLGKVRLRRKGSCGGQKGLHSIIQSLGTEEFPRLRVGIGFVKGEMVFFVLSKFRWKERKRVRSVVKRAAHIATQTIVHHIDYAMNLAD
jgi:peptidyl-tRNA hydrolase, PTH1 family